MNNVLRYWYGQSYQWMYRTWIETIQTLDGTFAVRDTLAHISQPIFQDYTYQGRIIGFFFRVGRIIVGLFIYALASLVFALFYLVWLLFPVICIVWIVGAFIGPKLGGI